MWRSAITIPDCLKLDRGDDLAPIYLRSLISFEFEDDPKVKGDRKVGTRGYSHTVSLAEDGEILLRWEWHPENPRCATTHLHVGFEQHHPDDGVPFSRLHLPTSRVTFEQVVEFVIDDLGVVVSDTTAASRVGDARRQHEQHRSWHGAAPADEIRSDS